MSRLDVVILQLQRCCGRYHSFPPLSFYRLRSIVHDKRTGPEGGLLAGSLVDDPVGQKQNKTVAKIHV